MAKNAKTAPKVKRGDVFQFQLTGKGNAYGQIVVPGDVIYVIVFEEVFENNEVRFEVNSQLKIALCGWTLDGRIFNGMWKIVCNAPLPEGIPCPCYKVGNDGVLWVESFDGELMRLAAEKDSQLLDNRTTIAPIRFEKALAAIHGLQEWDAAFDKLRVEYARERVLAC